MTLEVGIGRPAPGTTAWPAQSPVADECDSVLVAADDPDLRRKITVPLRRHGFEVIEVAATSDALEVVRRERITVAIVEVARPGSEAQPFLRRWHETGSGASVPVVLVTSRVAAQEVGAGIHDGAYDYLLPPFEAVDVLARTLSARQAKRHQDDLRQRVVELEQLVLTDALTGLYNRRHMEAELGVLASAARRQGTPLGILLVDVDRFKRINDRLSHEAGDTALQRVANRIRSIVRTEDVVGRWGGDEFLVLLPSTDGASTLTLAQRLRRDVASSCEGELPVPLTVSVGCAAAYEPDASLLINVADAALHRAKAGGRNRVSA